MATLRRCGSKTRPWEVRWRDPRTDERPRRRFATRAEAQRMLGEALGIEALSPAAPIERRWTLRRLIDEEDRSATRRSASTRKTRCFYYQHIPVHLLDQDVRRHTVDTIESVLNEAAGRLCLSSVEKLRSILHSVYRYGQTHGAVDRNPVKGARITAPARPSSRARKVVDDEVDPDEIPSPGEAEAIVAAIDPRFRVLVMCLYLLGLRLGEAVALDVSDWNRDERVLRVRRSGASTDRTKGKRSFRDVLVFDWLAARIDDHISRYCGPVGPLFPGPAGGRLSPSNFRRRYFYPAVDEALGQAALDRQQRRRIRPHDLRHLAASIMIENGISELEIASQLGHTNADFTRRLYGGVWRRQERQVASRMQEWTASRLPDR